MQILRKVLGMWKMLRQVTDAQLVIVINLLSVTLTVYYLYIQGIGVSVIGSF